MQTVFIRVRACTSHISEVRCRTKAHLIMERVEVHIPYCSSALKMYLVGPTTFRPNVVFIRHVQFANSNTSCMSK